MKNNLIAHISDVHVRFGSRHEEASTVFQRTEDLLKKIKPRRIVLTGDLFHVKINLSPNAIKIAGRFLRRLADIAPVDVFPGNHDWNSQSPAQGNAIDPIVELLNNGYVVTKESKELPEPEHGHGIYFFKESGFYDVDDDLVYGVYSCFDNELLTLTKKEKNKKYISFFHGPVYGCIGDNGYELKGDENIKLSVFNNFDMVMLGDIHEHQSFSLKGSKTKNVAYAGSLIQQNNGEGLDKGFLVWDINKNTFNIELVPNDFGFSKLNISAGEDIEERIRDMKLSFNPKKTKISIEYSDYEENRSIELLKQIEHLVKKIHGCEVVDVEFSPIKRTKENGDELEVSDYTDIEQFEELLLRFLQERDFDEVDDVIELSREIDRALNLSEKEIKGVRWEGVRLVVNNLFMFPDKDIEFDLDKNTGITGIIGENYCGKSNVIRALIWVLYKKMLGGGDSDKLVNLYTKSNKGYGRVYLRISGEEYCIERGVTIKKKKDGSSDVSYTINYTKKVGDAWIKEDSEEEATQKKATDKVVNEAIGTFEDFTKVALLSQKGFGGYLTLTQQPKNDLVNKYLGLEPFRDRYEYGNETFKKIKNTQKALGDPIQLEEQVNSQNKIIEDEGVKLEELGKEKAEVNNDIDGVNNKILAETENIIKLEEVEESNIDIIKEKIQQEDNSKKKEEEQIPIIEEWLEKNFKKEVPISTLNLSKTQVEKAIEDESKNFKSKKQDYINVEEWIKISKKKEEIDTKEVDEYLKENFKKEIPKLNTKFNKEEIESEIKKETELFNIQKQDYTNVEEWIKINKKKEEIDTKKIDEETKKINDALSRLEDKLKVSKGGNEKCPTCGHLISEPDPALEKDCLDKIGRGKVALAKQTDLLKQAKDIITHNNEVDKKSNSLDSLKNTLESINTRKDKLIEDLDSLSKIDGINKHNKEIEEKAKISQQAKDIISYNNDIDKKVNNLDSLKNVLVASKQKSEELRKELEISAKIEEINIYNKEIEDKNKQLQTLKKTVENRTKQIQFLNDQIIILNKNVESIEKNKVINKKIDEYKDDIKALKVRILQIDEKIKESTSATSIAKNNIENYSEKLKSIRDSERIYKKYSTYLQAVHRDGIPAQIIRQKLPVINYKVNNLLKDIVEFKIELYVESNGDVKEMFYYGDNKAFSLPFNMSSGAQDFLGGVAIQNALHFVSKLSKPSLCMIDEGFGTLDEKHVSDINIMFNYFRKTYKNTLIITHKNEIKDFVDNIIYVSKTTDGLSEEQLKENPHGGISIYDMKK